MSIETLILLSSSLNVTMDYIIYGYEDTEPRLRNSFWKWKPSKNSLGTQRKKALLAMELLRLFLKACDEK